MNKIPNIWQPNMEHPFSVRIPVGRVFLNGALAVPHQAEGLVIFAHGSGSSHLSPRNQFVARVLRESGNGTLLVDLLTIHEEAEDKLTGKIRFDIEFLADRLNAITQWVLQHSTLSELRLGYFGSSTGGAAALVAAARLGTEIEAVVSRGGQPDLAEEALSTVQAATLLIVGECDDVVLELNRQAFAILGCEKKLVTVPGATHLFEEPGALEEVARLAAEWFQKHLTDEE